MTAGTRRPLRMAEVGVACCVLSCGSAAAQPPRQRPVAAVARAGVRVHLLSLAYGRFRPPGAYRHFVGLRLRTRVVGGQLLELRYQEVDRHGRPDGVGGSAHMVCRGKRRTGRTEATVLPIEGRLSRGLHRIRVSTQAGRCGGGRAVTRTRTFRLRVR